MKQLSIAFFALIVTVSAVAQNEPQILATEGPRWGVGIELLQPVLGPSSVRIRDGIQGVVTYAQTDHRSWRLGYGHIRSVYDRGFSSYMQDTVLIRSSFNSQFIRHGFSLGHQWSFFEAKVRPIVGLDAVMDFQRHRERSTRAEHLRDSTNTGWSREVGPTSRTRYQDDYLWLGLSGAVGVEYRPHTNLMFQLRFSMGYAQQIHTRSDRPMPGSGYSGLWLPTAGTGLFVQFLF